jgi:integrase
MALTSTEIQRSKATTKPYKLADERGLFLLVTPSGGKLWRWKYRVDGKEKLMSFGAYPDVTLAMARERHQNARRLLASGIDPMAQRKAEKTAERTATESLFASVAEKWLAHWRQGVTERHGGMVERRVKADILPALGARQIDAIEALEVVAMAKATDARGAHETARRALEVTGQIFAWAVANGYAKGNPAAGIKPTHVLAPFKSENFARVDAKELPALLKAISEYRGSAVTKLAMRLLAYTAVRTSELIEAPWSEIDLDRARWEIPPERMKMRDAHIVPLSRQAVHMFRALHQITGHTSLCFPGDRNPKQPLSNNTLLKMLERLGYKSRMTGHGWRSIFSTEMHEQGWEERYIEAALAHHKRDKIAAAYNRAAYLEQRVRLLQNWADYLDQQQHVAKVIMFAS